MTQQYIIRKELLASFRNTAGNDRLPALEEGFTVQHDQTSAGIAADFDVRPGAGDSPEVASAGMRFAGADDVADADGFHDHGIDSFLTESI